MNTRLLSPDKKETVQNKTRSRKPRGFLLVGNLKSERSGEDCIYRLKQLNVFLSDSIGFGRKLLLEP